MCICVGYVSVNTGAHKDHRHPIPLHLDTQAAVSYLHVAEI